MVGRRARKSMSGAADDSTTKFPISGKVPLEWLMHRSASPSPGHAQSVGVFVTPGRPTTRGFGLVDARSRWLCATCLDNVTPNTGSPCVATVQLGGVSRPSNVRASARSMSQWVCSLLGFFIVPSGCGVPSLIVSSAPRSNLSFVWVVERWVWMLLLVRNGHAPVARSLCILSLDMNDDLAPLWPLPYLGSALRSMRDERREGMLPVKKLVVGPRGGSAGPPHGEHRSAPPYCRRCAPGLNWSGRSFGAVTLKKLECSKQAYACIH
ncbi:hypothetical protein V6N13_019515 [Hibiscus sabdariffa]